MLFPFRTLGIGLLLALFLRGAPSAYARVVISEVLWAGSDLSSADEWLEMACIEDAEDVADEPYQECAIGGWSLTYLDSKNVEQTMVTFSPGTVIGLGEYFLVSNYAAAESRLAIAPDLVTSAVNLPNTKLLLRLRDAFTAIIDEVDDAIGEPFSGLNGVTKASMERIDLYGTGNTKENWITALASVNFDPDAPLLGTPKASRIMSFSSSSSSSFPPNPDPDPDPITTLFITEILPNPEGSDTEEWIEIGNVGAAPVPIAGLLLSTGTGTARKTFALPTDASGGLLLPQTFRSFRNHQSHLTLLNDGTMVSLLSGDSVLDSVTYPAIPEGMSYGRSAGSGSWRVYCIPTEREMNTDKPIGLSISVQSGKLEAQEKTSINVTAHASYVSALNGALCRWEYPDGFAPDTCNPPSHTLSMTGIHLITLRAQLQCGREERATVTARIHPEHVETAEETEVRTYSKNSVIISAAVPYSSHHDGRWVALRNTSEEAIDLTGFSLHGGLIPNDRYVFSGVILLSREERRFPGELLRMDFPLPKGTLLLRDPSKSLISVLGWDALKDGSVVRPPVTPVGSIAVEILRVVDGDTFDVKILNTNDPDLPPSILHRWSAQEMSPSPALRVRLIGVDAPALFYETGELSHTGLEALNSVRALIDNTKIELQFGSTYWDPYERILAYAVLPNSEELLQTALLRNGSATAVRDFIHPYQDYFIALEEEAQLEKKGLWAFHAESILFTSADPVMTYASVSSSVLSSRSSFSSFVSFSSSSSLRSLQSSKKKTPPAFTPLVLASQTKVKWRVQSASSSDRNTDSSVLSSGSLLASLNIIDFNSEEKPGAGSSQIHLPLAQRLLNFFMAILKTLRSVLT